MNKQPPASEDLHTSSKHNVVLDLEFLSFSEVPAATRCLGDRRDAVIKGQKEEDVPWM